MTAVDLERPVYRPGTLTVIRGPMFSGKTSKAIGMALFFESARCPVRYVRPVCSRRPFERPGMVASHAGDEFPVFEFTHIAEILPGDIDAAVVVFGEAMLWPDQENLYQTVCGVRDSGRMAIVETLTVDRNRQPFGLGSVNLLAVADYVASVQGDCPGCGEPDSTTQSWALEASDGIIDVGGSEKYVSLCPDCWGSRWRARLS